MKGQFSLTLQVCWARSCKNKSCITLAEHVVSNFSASHIWLARRTVMWHVFLVIPFSIVWTTFLETQIVFLAFVYLKECITCQKRITLIETGLFFHIVCLLFWHRYRYNPHNTKLTMDICVDSLLFCVCHCIFHVHCREVRDLGQLHLLWSCWEFDVLLKDTSGVLHACRCNILNLWLQGGQ